VLRVDSVGQVAEDSEPDHKREECHLNPRGGDDERGSMGPRHPVRGVLSYGAGTRIKDAWNRGAHAPVEQLALAVQREN
jgi:hypothetical protein